MCVGGAGPMCRLAHAPGSPDPLKPPPPAHSLHAPYCPAPVLPNLLPGSCTWESESPQTTPACRQPTCASLSCTCASQFATWL
eukprot:1161195-Pelagomonas_calceolata.AAC.28